MNNVPATPKGHQYVSLVDPYLNIPVAPIGANGRYADAKGNSLLIRNKPFSAADNTTDSAIIAAVPYYIIAVVGYIVQSGATPQNFTFNSKGSGSGTAISHTMQNGVNGGATRPILYGGAYFSTLPGEGLTGTTSSASGAATKGMVDYVLVPDPSIQWADGSPILGADGQPLAA
jgi:hypothetical protein